MLISLLIMTKDVKKIKKTCFIIIETEKSHET